MGKLSPAETVRKATLLGVFSGLMIIFGYPGEMIPAGSPNIGYRWLFWAVSLCPFIYILPCMGLSGANAIVGVQIGYTISDIISKCGVGLLIYKVTYAKSLAGKDSEPLA